MKKKVYAIVLAGVLAFALTACSRPEDSGSEPESSAAPTTAPTTAVTTTEAPTTTTTTTHPARICPILMMRSSLGIPAPKG